MAQKEGNYGPLPQPAFPHHAAIPAARVGGGLHRDAASWQMGLRGQVNLCDTGICALSTGDDKRK